jgi:hypothetical protein
MRFKHGVLTVPDLKAAQIGTLIDDQNSDEKRSVKTRRPIIVSFYQASYETTPKWHGFLMIKLAAFQTSCWAEQRTAEPQNIE